MKRLADLTDAEISILKAAYSTIPFQMAAGETRWCDRLDPWERFELNVDTTVELLFMGKWFSDDDREQRRAENPELYDIIKSTFAEVSELNVRGGLILDTDS